MDQMVARDNLKQALKRVKKNHGSPGVDGMTVGELPGYLATHWIETRGQLLAGTYQPQPVRRCEIPKAGGCGATIILSGRTTIMLAGGEELKTA